MTHEMDMHRAAFGYPDSWTDEEIDEFERLSEVQQEREEER